MKSTYLLAILVLGLAYAGKANPLPRRASITGGGGDGRCVVTVSVDHTAEVEITGDKGALTTTGGAPAAWKRFDCNTPMPRNPADFRLVRLAGRGTQRLIQDPRNTAGRAVVQISDTKGGRADYSFELRWLRSENSGWNPGPPLPRPLPPAGPNGIPVAAAIRTCQDSVTDEISRRGYSYVGFDRIAFDKAVDRVDWISGAANGKKGFIPERFSFTCSVDSRSGIVRSLDVSRR